jgi:hypothetical protein
MSDLDGGQPVLPWTERAAGVAGRTVRAWLAAARTSWPATVTPRTRTDTWEASKVDIARIPQAAGADHAEILWKISNATDRIILFGLAILIGLIPRADRVAGAGYWLAERPWRRWPALWLTLTAVAWLIGAVT